MKPIDPIFAPICFGDDRQVGRTRRGLHNIFESFLDPSYVYCVCLRSSCQYKWRIPKEDYIGPGTGGTGDTGYWPEHFYAHKNLGKGGTGHVDIVRNYEEYLHPLGMIVERGGTGLNAYSKYTENEGCRIGGIGAFTPDHDYNPDEILIIRKFPCIDSTSGWGTAQHDIIQTISPDAIYPYDEYRLNSGEVGCTGGIDPYTIEEEYYLSDYFHFLYNSEKFENFYDQRLTRDEFINENLGRSGGPGDLTFSKLPPKAFGCYPLICPNCAKVNFKAYWIETLDNPVLGPSQQTLGRFFLNNPHSNIEDFTTLNLCKMCMVIDIQIKNINRDFSY